MNISGNDSHFQLYSPYAQERCSNTFCYWETQSAGCLRISCAFRHRKPRYINGLYLPSTNSPPRNQETISQPVYPSLVINLNNEEDEDDEESDEEEENYVSDWEPKNAAEVEELRAIKEICHKSGEYYGIQHLHEQQSTKTTSSRRENEPLPLKNTKQDFQKGDSNTIPTKFNDTGGEGESSERRGSVPRTNHGSLENGETNHTELIKNHHQKEVKKNYISEEPKNPPNRVTGKETNHTELVKNHHPKEVKKNYVSEEPRNPPNRVTGKETNHTELVKNHHQKEVKKNYVSEEPKNPPTRVTGKETNHTELIKNHHPKEVKKNFVSEEPRNPPNRVTGKETNHTELVKNHHQKEVKKNYVSEEPKNPPTRVTGKETNHTELVKNHHPKEVKKNCVSEEPRNPPTRVTGKETNHTELVKNHHQKEVKKNYVSEEPKNPPNRVTGKDPKIKPGYQQRDRRKDEETAYSTLYVKKGGRNTYFNSSEPRRTVYVFYRSVNVTQEPKFSGSTVEPESYGGKCFKQKYQNRSFRTQHENYDKYTSASYNEPTWRKRNPHAKTFSKFKTTIQSQENMEGNGKGDRYVERRQTSVYKKNGN